MGGVRVRVVPVRGDAPRGRVVRLPAGTGGFRHGGSCGACVSRRRGWRPLRHGGAVRAGRGVAAAPAVVPCPPEAGGFRTGGSCSCRCGWRPYRRCAVHAGTGGPVPTGGADQVGAGGPAPGGAAPAGSGRLPHRRVVLPMPVRLAVVRHGGAGGETAPARWCRARRKQAASAPAGRARAGAAGGRTGAVPCTPVRADPYRRVVPIRPARADPHRVMPCPPEAGGFRTGGSCSCRCGWRPYRRCAVHAGTGGPVPTGGADQVGAGGPAPGGAGRCGRGARAGWCRGAGCGGAARRGVRRVRTSGR